MQCVGRIRYEYKHAFVQRAATHTQVQHLDRIEFKIRDVPSTPRLNTSTNKSSVHQSLGVHWGAGGGGAHLLDQVGVGTARGDELLQVLDVILLLLVLLALDDLILLHRLAEGVVVTRVVRQLLLRQPDDVRAHPVQEILRASRLPVS